jgi:hypothetical protein
VDRSRPLRSTRQRSNRRQSGLFSQTSRSASRITRISRARAGVGDIRLASTATPTHPDTRRRSFSGTVVRLDQFRQAMPHSSRIRCENGSSQPSGSCVSAGLRSPCRKARHEQPRGPRRHHRCRQSSAGRRPRFAVPRSARRQTLEPSRASKRVDQDGSREGQFFAASRRENVLFPAPAMPVTTTRRTARPQRSASVKVSPKRNGGPPGLRQSFGAKVEGVC